MVGCSAWKNINAPTDDPKEMFILAETQRYATGPTCTFEFGVSGGTVGDWTARVYRTDSTGATCQEKKAFGTGTSSGSVQLSPCTCTLAGVAHGDVEVVVDGVRQRCSR